MRSISTTLPLLFLALLVAGCFTPADRSAQLLTIARWQDQRLAPGDSLGTMLHSDDAHVRLAAARASGLIGRTEIVPEVVALLDDGSSSVRCEAAWALGLIGDQRGLRRLMQASSGAQTALRRAAVAALAQFPNDGTALLAAARHADTETAALAWDGLRRQAERVDPDSLRQAITSGLAHSQSAVRWRTLRCAESFPDSSLVGLIKPFLRSRHSQEVVHAYRALAKQSNHEALTIVLAASETQGPFSARDLKRVQIAAARALAATGPVGLADETEAERISTVLVGLARASDPHVVETALAAMANLVTDLPLPAAAASQESLLPVWRIRLVQTARQRVPDSHRSVRAAAITALAALRGAGAAGELVEALAQEHSPHVLAAAMTAIAAHHPQPIKLLDSFFQTTEFSPDYAMVRVAALTGLNEVRLHLLRHTPAHIECNHLVATILTASTDPDFVVRTTAAELLGTLASDESVRALISLWDLAGGPGGREIQRGVLSGFSALCAPAGPDSVVPWSGPEVLTSEIRRVLRESFDSPDIRIRRDARRLATASRLLPASLIPSAGSLAATLPAVKRDPHQPAVAVPFTAPAIRCVSERGEFVIQLDGQLAPNTCALFLSLIEDNFFGAMTFHRVVPDFVIQGGDPDGTGWGGPGFTIRSEWSRASYDRATVGIATDGKDTGGSQFFVTLSPQPHLDGRYTVIGRVSQGMAVVDRIEAGDTFRLEIAD